jgi:hypothetical protein
VGETHGKAEVFASTPKGVEPAPRNFLVISKNLKSLLFVLSLTIFLFAQVNGINH